MPYDVLVVGDHPTLRGTLIVLLEREGYTARSAAGGLDAINALHREMPRLILVNLGMPPMNGQRLFGALRDDPRWASIPVVVLAATIDPALSTTVGFARVLEESVPDALLLHTLATVCPRRT